MSMFYFFTFWGFEFFETNHLKFRRPRVQATVQFLYPWYKRLFFKGPKPLWNQSTICTFNVCGCFTSTKLFMFFFHTKSWFSYILVRGHPPLTQLSDRNTGKRIHYYNSTDSCLVSSQRDWCPSIPLQPQVGRLKPAHKFLRCVGDVAKNTRERAGKISRWTLWFGKDGLRFSSTE